MTAVNEGMQRAIVDVDEDVAACREPGCGWEAYDGDLTALAADHRDNYRWHDAEADARMRAARARVAGRAHSDDADWTPFVQEMVWGSLSYFGPGHGVSTDGCGLEPVED